MNAADVISSVLIKKPRQALMVGLHCNEAKSNGGNSSDSGRFGARSLPTTELRAPGPHFFCIGPAKCATTWLADHLKLHYDIWLPPIQESSYLSSGFEMYRGSQHLEYQWDLWNLLKRTVRNKSLFGGRDREFYKAAQALAGKLDSEFDLAGYRALFAPAGNKLTGDISPSYAAMDREHIRRALPVLRGRKIFMIIRNPVARFWSHLSMLYRARSYGTTDYESLETAKRFFNDPLRNGHHFPTRILERWDSVVGPDQIQVFYFDDVVNRPTKTLRSMVEFIGGDYRKRIPLVSPSLNRKDKEAKVKGNPDAELWVRQAFSEELDRCLQRFGDRVRHWA